MLQQDTPDDFVIATGKQNTVREFVQMSAKALGIDIEFEGSEESEIGYVSSIANLNKTNLSVGDVIIKVDPRYYRPTEVENLLGNPEKAKRQLGWVPKTSVEEMCTEMVEYDLSKAKEKMILDKLK